MDFLEVVVGAGVDTIVVVGAGVDTIVDVIPLISGYSREAHGRLVFSECPGGRGWGDSSKQQPQSASWNKLVINYSLNDNGVRAIRLRE